MTSDEAVADAIRRVFEKSDELGPARQVLAWWSDPGPAACHGHATLLK